jgi:hypothetical protein
MLHNRAIVVVEDSKLVEFHTEPRALNYCRRAV